MNHILTLTPECCVVTCACGADDAVVDVRAAVDCDLQTVVGVMVLR